MRSHRLKTPLENKRVRLPVLLLCGMCLLLSVALLWWNKTDSTASSTGAATPPPTGPTPYAKPPRRLALSATGSVSVPDRIPVSDVLARDLLERVQKLLASGESSDRDLVFTNLLPALVKMNPELAAQFAESTTSDLLRADTLRTVAQSWTAVDSSSAISWATQLPDVAERNLELSYVCNEIAVTDPAKAVQTVTQLDLGERTEAVLQNVAEKWAAQNFSEAKTWALAEPTGDRRDNLLARIACVHSATSPVEAAQLIVAQIPAGPIQSEAVLSVIYQWGIRDMTAAAAWVSVFPPGPLKTRAAQQLSGIAAYQSAPSEMQN